MSRRAFDDRGAASVWLLAVGLVLVAAGVAGAAVGAATVARHQAETAADLGALAGAADAREGPAGACGRAGEIVAANGGRLVGCVLDGFDVTITVEVSVAPIRGISRTARASARAGPLRTLATTAARPAPDPTRRRPPDATRAPAQGFMAGWLGTMYVDHDCRLTPPQAVLA